jgi:broad specificity phosphatase PhoE
LRQDPRRLSVRIYVVRHGEAEDDVEDAYGGCANFRLTDAGREQAAAVAAGLKASGLQAIFSSPLARAVETAEILGKGLGGGIPLNVLPDLRERNSYGVLSGVPKARAAEIFGYILAELNEKPGYSREPLLGAEEFDEFVERVRRGFETVVEKALSGGYESVAIVTHGKFTQALCEFVFKFGDKVDLDLSDVLAVDYLPARATIATN